MISAMGDPQGNAKGEGGREMTVPCHPQVALSWWMAKTSRLPVPGKPLAAVPLSATTSGTSPGERDDQQRMGIKHDTLLQK